MSPEEAAVMRKQVISDYIDPDEELNLERDYIYPDETDEQKALKEKYLKFLQDKKRSQYEPLFSVNWGGLMRARAGYIGLYHPWMISDYGLTSTIKNDTIFLGDAEVPTNIEKWEIYPILPQEAKNTIKLLPNGKRTTQIYSASITRRLLDLVNKIGDDSYLENYSDETERALAEKADVYLQHIRANLPKNANSEPLYLKKYVEDIE